MAMRQSWQRTFTARFAVLLATLLSISAARAEVKRPPTTEPNPVGDIVRDELRDHWGGNLGVQAFRHFSPSLGQGGPLDPWQPSEPIFAAESDLVKSDGDQLKRDLHRFGLQKYFLRELDVRLNDWEYFDPKTDSAPPDCDWCGCDGCSRDPRNLRYLFFRPGFNR